MKKVYSKISEIYIKDFRNLGEVILDFKDSPIISLVGDNEAGKTSVVKAFGVCAKHICPRDQKEFIRDGTAMFGIAIKLEDGTMIKRVKTATANRYTVEKNGEVIFNTSKLSEGLPAIVQDIMGLIEEPETKELLNIRTYEDKMLFVTTPASTNYRVMYGALQIEQISKAIKLGSTEVNGLLNEVRNNEMGIEALNDSIRKVRVVDISVLKVVKERLKKNLETLDKLHKAVGIKEKISGMEEQLGELNLLDEKNVHEVDTSEVMRLIDVMKAIGNVEVAKRKIESIAEIAELPLINEGVIQKMQKCIEKKSEYLSKVKWHQTLQDVDTLGSGISEQEMSKLQRAIGLVTKMTSLENSSNYTDVSTLKTVSDGDMKLISLMDKFRSLTESIMAQEKEKASYDKYISDVHDWMVQIGVKVVNCPKCGESVVVEGA